MGILNLQISLPHPMAILTECHKGSPTIPQLKHAASYTLRRRFRASPAIANFSRNLHRRAVEPLSLRLPSNTAPYGEDIHVTPVHRT
jgi:hypothetical protein